MHRQSGRQVPCCGNGAFRWGCSKWLAYTAAHCRTNMTRWNSFWRVSRKPFESIPRQSGGHQAGGVLFPRRLSAVVTGRSAELLCRCPVPLSPCRRAGDPGWGCMIRRLREHLLAGYFHPAYGELAESHLYLRQLKEAAADCGKPELFVETAPRTMSKCWGSTVATGRHWRSRAFRFVYGKMLPLLRERF